MTTTRRCPSCGSELAADAAYGVCPRCLLQPNLFGADSLGPSPGEAQTAAPSAMAGRGARVLPPPSPDELAEHFPQLEILELIGQGGMGAVYKARQRGLDRFVALKILAPAANDDAQFAERFSREARALARLNHPHIVGVFDSGRAGPYFYLTLEYVDGVNLRQAMRAGTIQPGQALEMVTQICEALQYAHNEHVVHRDIKPENVMVDQHGQVKVADFGLAKLVDPDTPDHGLTATHQVMGTPRYMAPEQLEGARDVDHRADIYSLGVIFYELLTGELPLGRFPPPSRRVRVDVRLDEVVLRTLEKQPELRYQQAEDLRTDVDGIRSTPSAKARQQNGYEYRSAAAIFGLPLLHVAMGVDAATGKRRVAKGVIAIGDVAIGGIAIGGMAMGGVAIGGVTCGVLALGGLALGLLVFGGLAAGFVAMGGAAAGYLAVGGVAFGPRAYGGLTLPPRAVAAQVQYAPLHFTPPLATDMRTMSPEAPSVPPEAPSAPPETPAEAPAAPVPPAVAGLPPMAAPAMEHGHAETPQEAFAERGPFVGIRATWFVILLALVVIGVPCGLVALVVWMALAHRRRSTSGLAGDAKLNQGFASDHPPASSGSEAAVIIIVVLVAMGVVGFVACSGVVYWSRASVPPPSVRLN